MQIFIYFVVKIFTRYLGNRWCAIILFLIFEEICIYSFQSFFMKNYFLVDIGRDFLLQYRFLSSTLTTKIQETLSA